MTAFESAFNTIQHLVKKFDEGFNHYMSAGYSEAEARQDFIDDFFIALGWDVSHKQQTNPYEQEVKIERSQKQQNESARKRADYAFFLNPNYKDEVFFVEAKKPSVFIKEDLTPAYQVKRYGWNAKLAVSIVTDFEEFAIYDCSKKPSPKDKTSTGRIKYLNYNEYLSEFEFLWETFAKERVLRGSFDKFIKSDASKKGTSTVDADFLHSMEEWRKQLATNIAINNHSFDEDDINYVVQQTLDRIIFLKMAGIFFSCIKYIFIFTKQKNITLKLKS